METLKYSVGLTRLEVTRTELASGTPLLQIDQLPGPTEKLSPQKLRELATLLKIAADAADPPKPEDVGLYATIRERSKYYKDQQEKDPSGRPIPFPVTMATSLPDGYFVKGGMGGRYTLYDVDLWTKSEGEYFSLPVHDSPYPCKLKELKPCESVS